MKRVSVSGVATLLLVIMVSVQPVAGADSVIGSPEIDLSVRDNHFSSNTDADVEVWITNNGDLEQGGPAQHEQRVKTARNLQMSIDESRLDAPIDVQSGTVSVGSVPEGGAGPYSFDIEIGDAEPGTYRIPVEVSYDYTRSVEYSDVTAPDYNDFSREETKYIEIVIERRPEFEIATSESENVFAGDTGRLKFSLRNTGVETAYDPRIRLESGSEGVFFGGMSQRQRSRTVSSSPIEPGSVKEYTIKVGADSDVVPGKYPVNAVVEYENSNGVTETSETLRTNVDVMPERTFTLEDVSSEALRVDEDDATVSGSLTNMGSSPVRNVVVTVSSGDTSGIRVTGGESAVGDLGAGESSEVGFDLSVNENAEPGSRELVFDVKYENSYGETRRYSEPIRKSFEVGEEIDPFEVTSVNTSLTSGGTAEMRVDVTNNADYAADNINAKVFVSDPISSGDDEAFLGEMGPGETKTAVFTVSATSSAIPKEYTGSMEIRYDDRGGDTQFTDSLSVGIPIEESEGGGPPVPYVVAGLVVVVVAVGAFVWRRRT
ncbi:COG1361 S-layer family protein [Halorutilales archaeon Cl-col2-1]